MYEYLEEYACMNLSGCTFYSLYVSTCMWYSKMIHKPCVLVSCWETLVAMVACVEEVCKIWIWLFWNVRGETFEGSSVVRMSRGNIWFRLPFCRQAAVRARQKAVAANRNSRDLMNRLGPAPKSGTRPIWPISVDNRRQKPRCTFVYRLVARLLGGIPISGVLPFKKLKNVS